MDALAPASRLHDLLDAAADRFPHREAVRDAAGSWTYLQLVAYSEEIARRLGDSGVRTGDRVLSLVGGCREFAALLYGASRCGAILVPCGEDTTDYQLRWLLEDAEPALVVVAGEGRPDRDMRGTSVVALKALVSGTTAAVPLPVVDPDAPVLLIYTSGSTSRPKGIVCPHRTVTWTARAIGQVLGYRESDVVYNRLPVSFDYGLYQILLCSLAGAVLVFGETDTMPRTLHAIRSSGATVVPVVPTFAALLVQLAGRDSRPTTVRMFTNTGAALVGADAARLRAAFPGASLVCMYGMSESKRITIADPDEDLDFPGTVGRPIPGTRVLVLDDDDVECEPGRIGQIVTTGPHVMAGYWRAPAATAERFIASPDGHGRALRTGDYGLLDEAGRLYFSGRRDDLFKRRGLRLSTQEIESAALDIPHVRAAACVATSADEPLVIWVEGDVTEAEVIRGVGERIGLAKAPDKCRVVTALPHTPNGKIDKNALRTSSAARGE